MGAPKQKWTSEEEEALRAGVAKHGTGKWKNIQKDPEFGHCLAARSNIDLKDKWRNMSVSASGQGSREKLKIAKVKPAPAIPSSNIDTPSSIPAAQDAAALIGVAQDATAKNATAKDDTARDDTAKDATGKDATAKDPTADKPIDTSKGSPDGKASPGWHLSVQVTSNRMSGKQMKKTESKYNIYILKALSTMNDPNGSGITAINDFIEQNYEVPPNFRRMLSAKLRRLVAQEKIEKIQNSYKVKKDTLFGTRTPTLKQKEIRPMPPPQTATLNDGIEEAAITAAYRIADAENKSFLADTAVKEAERVAKMAEESDSLLQLAKEIYERCLSGEIVSMA